MADKKEKAEAAPEGGEAAPKSKKKLIMFIVIGVVVLVLIVGGVLGYFMMSKKKAAEEEGDGTEETAAATEKKGKEKDKKDGHAALPVFYKFDKPFTVRLSSDGGEAYLQVDVQMKLLDATGADAMKANDPELKHKITLLLLSKKGTDLNTAEGVEKLSWEIRDAANHTLHPPKPKKKGAAADHAAEATADVEPDAPVQAVLFTTFIVQ
jgi:flagellar FliL protein